MKKISFKIVPESGLSLYEQIKNQIISSLYTGKIQEGDPLPSVRELAESAGVNPKTIHRIYRQLREEHHLRMVPGKGVFIRQRQEADFSRLRREALLTLVRSSLEKAALLGLGPEKFIQLLQRYANDSPPPLGCILVDDEEELEAFSLELAGKLEVRLYPVLLADMDEKISAHNPEIRDFPYVLTTSWHLERVEPKAAALGKKLLEIKPDPGVYGEVARQMRTRNVAVVVRDLRTLHTSFGMYRNIFYPSTAKRFIIATLADEELLEQIARESDVVFCSPLCLATLRRRLPPGKEIRGFENFISDEFIESLKKLGLFE